MKGPGLRIDLDVRRVWRCAKCGKTVRTPVQVVAQRCSCPDAPWMTLQPPVKREPFRPPLREPLPESEPAPAQPVTPSVAAAAAPVVEEPSLIFPAAEPLPEGAPAELPDTAADPARSVAEPPPAATPELAVAAPAASAPAATEPAAANPPPDDFGAGLDNPSPEAPA